MLCGTKEIGGGLLEVIRDELNVKSIEFIGDAGEYVTYEVKPQLKTLGPKYGKLIGEIKKFLAENGEHVVSAVKKDGFIEKELGGTLVHLTQDDLLIGIINREGFASESGDGLTVILDTELSPELIKEGLSRELVSKLQTMRKEKGFFVTDRIIVYYHSDSPDIREVMESGSVAKEVLADKVVCLDQGKEWNINGLNVKLDVEKI